MSPATAALARATGGSRLSPRLAAILAEELGELPGDEPWRGEVVRRAAVFQEVLWSGSVDAVLAAAAKLVGLGEGSTPAGDDYLVGVLHALAFNGRGRAERSLLPALGEVGEGRTTTASASWLAAAARGEASPVWRTLLDTLAAGHDVAARRAAGAVRATGHTSGAFSLRGFLDTVIG
ncbi:MAG TPA: DUF2877 domain-containing protein [Thermoanaerobaculia bacterium]|nr:DUF2877 domain-containing protein [Thermoanaerobaculia bacterium]